MRSGGSALSNARFLAVDPTIQYGDGIARHQSIELNRQASRIGRCGRARPGARSRGRSDRHDLDRVAGGKTQGSAIEGAIKACQIRWSAAVRTMSSLSLTIESWMFPGSGGPVLHSRVSPVPEARVLRGALRGGLGLPFLCQRARHRGREPRVHLHKLQTGPRPRSAVRGVVWGFLLGGFRPSGRSHGPLSIPGC
jgi:hypothetical protein